MCIKVDNANSFIVTQIRFNAFIMSVSNIMASSQYHGKTISLQNLMNFFGQQGLSSFHISVQTLNRSNIKKLCSCLQMIGHFSQLFSNSIRTFDGSNSALISFYAFIAGITQKTKSFGVVSFKFVKRNTSHLFMQV